MTLARDITSAYVVTVTRVVAWLAVSALVYRRLGVGTFALLTLVRSTVGILGNTSLGLAPAMIAKLAQALGQTPLPLESCKYSNDSYLRTIYSSGLALVLMLSAAAALLAGAYGIWFTSLHKTPAGLEILQIRGLVWFMSFGVIARFVSDIPAAVLQTRQRIALDNTLLAISELVWLAGSAAALLSGRGIACVGAAFLLANALLLLSRQLVGAHLAGRPDFTLVGGAMLRSLLAMGSLVALAELADFLYAPTDYIIINRMLGPDVVADYAPAVWIDGAILLLVLAVADVLLPTAALAHHAGQRAAVRRYYLRGTAATLVLLIAGSIAAYCVAPYAIGLWLGPRVRLEQTMAILPLVLIHTVVGGASIVGRSILLAMNKVAAFTGSVLMAGTLNVLLSVYLVHRGWGLGGVVAGTIFAVACRCGIWMPWYVMRCLNRAETPPVLATTRVGKEFPL